MPGSGDGRTGPRANAPIGPRPRPRPVPRPHATLAILYLFAFFLLYCFVLIAPALWQVLVSIPPGPDQQAVAEQVARDTLRPKLLFAFLAALASVAVGTWRRILPGTR